MMSLLAGFARHRIAPNVLMFLVILVGLWALERLNTQFLPDFEPELIQITADWPGAGPEEIQESYTLALEDSLTGISAIDTLEATSFTGGLRIDIALAERAEDPDQTLREIERAVSTVDVPAGAESPEVEPFVFYERVADVLIHGEVSLEALRYWVEEADRTLSDAGIAQIDITGLPVVELILDVPSERYLETAVPLNELARQVSGANTSAPAGLSATRGAAPETQWQLPNQLQTAGALNRLVIASGAGELPSPLSTFGSVRSQYPDDEARLEYQGRTAVRLSLSRASGENTLEVAERLNEWQAEFSQRLPQGLDLHVYNEDWKFVQSRLSIIIDSGIGGIVLVLAVLFLFLNHRVAFWVAVGIPVTFLATLTVMELTGNSINLISLFGFLVALGIIVDDAIVVGEQTFTRVEGGESPQDAAVNSAQRMLPAVLASSVTTVAAFLPLLLVTGQAGTFTISVPLVVIFAIIASLIECFLILPGHLAHSLKPGGNGSGFFLRRWFDRGFNAFRQRPFRALVHKAIRYRLTTYSVAISLLGLAFLLVASGRVPFVFFPDIQQEQVTLEVDFAPDTPPNVIEGYLDDMASALLALEDEWQVPVVDTMVQELYRGSPHSGALFVGLAGGVERPLSNDEILRAWRDQVPAPAGLLAQRFTQPQQGPSTGGVSVQLRGSEVDGLKAASRDLQASLRQYGGLREIGDDLPVGGEALTLTPNALALEAGLDGAALATATREFTQGVVAQTLQVEGTDRVVRVQLEGSDTAGWANWQHFPVRLPNGSEVPLSNLVSVEFSTSVDQLNRVDRQLAVEVSATVADPALRLNQVNAWLRSDVIDGVAERHGVSVQLTGDQESQAQFLRDVQFGALVGLVLIFGALAWVFESWLWPFAVLATIPFALTGAIAGHWLMGLELSALSIYGLFGLSGIVVNSGIVLLLFYRDLRREGLSVEDAVVEASVQRLRPVLLTTLTTVAGLSFLLTETSFDAQFLIPLAAGIVFGLGFGTVLILLLLPALLVSLETWRERLGRWRRAVVA